MGLWTVVADGLADLVGGELANHQRPREQRDRERGERREHCAQRDVLEHVERAHVLGEPLCKSEQHLVPSCRRWSTGQSLDDPLHPHEARALYKHRGLRPQFPSSCGYQGLHGGEVPSAFSEGGDAGSGERSRGVETVYAALARVPANLLVEFHTTLAHLCHVTEKEEFLARFGAKDLDRGAYRIRIRVVAVVDELRPRKRGPALHAPADRTERREAPRDRLEVSARSQGARRGGTSVQHVMATVGVELDPSRALACAQLDLASEMREAVAAAHLRRLVEA